MGEQISWHVELVVKPGEFENFQALTEEMIEFTRGEDGVLIYERFLSGDGKIVHVYERYVDSASALSHLLRFGREFGKRFSGMVDRNRFAVLGTPSEELKEVLDGFGATSYLGLFGGFTRGSGLSSS